MSPHLHTAQLVDNFTIVKWAAVYVASFFASLILFTEVTIPSKKMQWIALFLILSRIASVLYSPNEVSLTNLLESLVFVVLVIGFLTGLKNRYFNLEKLFWIFSGSSVLLIAFSITKLIQFWIIGGKSDPVVFSDSFGNINMLSDYLVLLLPFTIYYLRTFSGLKSLLSGVLLAAFSFVILMAQSRSAAISCIALLVYLLCRRISKKEIASGVLIILCSIAAIKFKTHGLDYGVAKFGSAVKRIELYKGSLTMLANSPFGVGGNGFEYNYIPFQMATGEHPAEREIYRTPHSEFIKWGIESGWAFMLAQLVWWFSLFDIAWRSKDEFSKMSLLVILPLLLFQFPFDNAVSFILLALITALILDKGDNEKANFGKIFAVSVTALLLFNAAAFSLSHYYDSNSGGNLDEMSFGCKIYPANWRACSSQGLMQVLSIYPNDALPVIKAELQKRPFQFVALRLLGVHQMRLGNLARSCQLGRIYDSLFFNKSLWSDFVAKNCADIQSPLVYKNGVQFKKDYQIFLDSILETAEERP